MPKKKYRVAGTQPVFDHQPGEEFTASIPAEQEETLIWGGHIQVVEEPKKDDKRGASFR